MQLQNLQAEVLPLDHATRAWCLIFFQQIIQVYAMMQFEIVAAFDIIGFRLWSVYVVKYVGTTYNYYILDQSTL
jgi:hypothetical protein